MTSYSPHYLPPRQADAFNQCIIKTIGQDLEKNSPITTELICKIGDAIAPTDEVKKAVNGLIFTTTDALKNDRLRGFTKTSDEVSISRFYVSGDYCGTGVGSFRTVRLICYLSHDPSLFLKPYVKFVAERLSDFFEARKTMDASATKFTASVHQDRYILVECHPMKVVLQFCSDAHSPKEGDVVVKIENAIRLIKSAKDDDALAVLRAPLDECLARLIASIPQFWKSFIRFCKYFCMMNMDSLVPMEAVEHLALKVLLQNDPSIAHCDADLVLLFFRFHSAIVPNSPILHEIDSIPLSPALFQRDSFTNVSQNLSNYGTQPKLSINWDMPVKVQCPHNLIITSLFDRSHCLTISPNTYDLKKALNNLIIQKQGEIGIRDLLTMGEQRNQQSSQGSGRCSKISNLIFIACLIITLIFCWFILVSIEPPHGLLSSYWTQRGADYIEDHYIAFLEWVDDNKYHAVFENPFYLLIEDLIGEIMVCLHEIPDMWELIVPESFRAALSYFVFSFWTNYSLISTLLEYQVHRIADRLNL